MADSDSDNDQSVSDDAFGTNTTGDTGVNTNPMDSEPSFPNQETNPSDPVARLFGGEDTSGPTSTGLPKRERKVEQDANTTPDLESTVPGSASFGLGQNSSWTHDGLDRFARLEDKMDSATAQDIISRGRGNNDTERFMHAWASTPQEQQAPLMQYGLDLAGKAFGLGRVAADNQDWDRAAAYYNTGMAHVIDGMHTQFTPTDGRMIVTATRMGADPHDPSATQTFAIPYDQFGQWAHDPRHYTPHMMMQDPGGFIEGLTVAEKAGLPQSYAGTQETPAALTQQATGTQATPASSPGKLPPGMSMAPPTPNAAGSNVNPQNANVPSNVVFRPPPGAPQGGPPQIPSGPPGANQPLGTQAPAPPPQAQDQGAVPPQGEGQGMTSGPVLTPAGRALWDAAHQQPQQSQIPSVTRWGVTSQPGGGNNPNGLQVVGITYDKYGTPHYKYGVVRNNGRRSHDEVMSEIDTRHKNQMEEIQARHSPRAGRDIDRQMDVNDQRTNPEQWQRDDKGHWSHKAAEQQGGAQGAQANEHGHTIGATFVDKTTGIHYKVGPDGRYQRVNQ